MSRIETRRNLQLCLTPTDKAKLLEIAEQFGCYPSNGRGKGPSISTLATRIAKGEILVKRVGKLFFHTERQGNRTDRRGHRRKKSSRE